MTSRARIFDHNGNQLTDILGNFRRSWVANDLSRCDFDFPTSDPKFNQDNFQYGNFILINHIPTKDALGNVNGTLPDWVGILYPPRDWMPGICKITAFSGEKVLERRAIRRRNVSGSPGVIFNEILKDANSWGYFPVQPGMIDTNGPNGNEKLVTSALAHAKHVAETYNQDFDVTAQVDIAGRLKLYGNWYARKGIKTGMFFTDADGGNIEFTSSILSEQGEITNDVRGHASKSGASKGSIAYDSSIPPDATSLGQYGGMMSNQDFNVDGQAAVDSAATAYLAQNSQPVVSIRPNILDRGKTFDGCNVGNVWQILLTTAGFYQGTLGFNANVRIKAMEYDEMNNKLTRVSADLYNG